MSIHTHSLCERCCSRWNKPIAPWCATSWKPKLPQFQPTSRTKTATNNSDNKHGNQTHQKISNKTFYNELEIRNTPTTIPAVLSCFTSLLQILVFSPISVTEQKSHNVLSCECPTLNCNTVKQYTICMHIRLLRRLCLKLSHQT